MDKSSLQNNQADIIGEVCSDFCYSHQIYGEKFYNTELQVPRLSQVEDIIPVTVSEKLILKDRDYMGTLVEVTGQFRSYNRQQNGHNRLLLTVFAREFKAVGDEEITRNPNHIYLKGYICKKPLYRTTPFGREITDLLIAVNRAYNKSDYIPCISWGRNSRYTSRFEIGDEIKLWGRIQSRKYQKRMSEDKIDERTAYEVSITKIEKAEEELEELT